MNRVYIKGIALYPFSSVHQIVEYVNKHPGILVAVNAEKIVNQTETTRGIINRNIGYCDGAGPQIALRRIGYKNTTKVAGCELWLSLIDKFYKQKTFYLVGSKQPVIDKVVAKLKNQYKGIYIAGYRNGYINSNTEKHALIDDICTKQPDVVFVAMGSPKQELLMEEMQRYHKAIYMGLGGSFDVYTGNAKRAPQWWINHNVEWLYRLIHQPSRIKRQIKLIRFAWWIVIKRL